MHLDVLGELLRISGGKVAMGVGGGGRGGKLREPRLLERAAAEEFEFAFGNQRPQSERILRLVLKLRFQVVLMEPHL